MKVGMNPQEKILKALEDGPESLNLASTSNDEAKAIATVGIWGELHRIRKAIENPDFMLPDDIDEVMEKR